MQIKKSLALFAVLTIVSLSQATTYVFSDAMAGSNENPPNSSTANGASVGTYDSSTRTLNLSVTASGFTTNVTAAHIHQAAVAGGNGSVIIPFGNQYNGGMTYNMPSTSFILNAVQETAFLHGLLYTNIHTVAVGGGEIRTFLHPFIRSNPSSVTIIQGSSFSGNLGSLANSDNSYYQMFDSEASLEAEVQFDSTSEIVTPTRLKLTFEAHAARPGLSQTINAFNFDSSVFEEVDGREALLSDDSFTITFTNADAMVSSTGQVRVQALWAPINDEVPSQDGWLLSVDQVQWTVYS